MEKLNFSAFSNVTERDKKILNALYKLLYRKFDIRNAFTWDMVHFLSNKISESQLPLLDLVNYLYVLKFNLTSFTDTRKFESPIMELDLSHINGALKNVVFSELLGKTVKKESFINSIKKCLNNKILFRYDGPDEITNVVTFDVDSIELGKVYVFYAAVLVNETFLKGLFVEIRYDESDDKKVIVTVRIKDNEKTFTLPSFWGDLRNIDEEALLKFMCKDLLPYYVEIIKETYSIQ